MALLDALKGFIDVPRHMCNDAKRSGVVGYVLTCALLMITQIETALNVKGECRMTVILLIIIVILLVVLLVQRGRSGYRDQPYYRERPYYDVTPPQYNPPSPGFEVGSFLGGMAAGALLEYLLEQGRIDMAQYDYFNSLDQQRMMDELMQQNIIQQHEIDELQRRLDDNNFGNDFGNYDHFDGPRLDSYADNVNYDVGSDDYNNFNDNDGDGGWV